MQDPQNNSFPNQANHSGNGIAGENSSVAETSSTQPAQNTHIVFIDSTVENYQSLAAGVKAGTEVIILDSTRDGVGQISEVLANRSDINSVHIVSHGGDGSLQLGLTELNAGNLEAYTSQLQQWKSALTPDADILLYGCNVASGQTGAAFVQQLSQLTGADVAASNDMTGSAALGGDWVLEFTTGKIEAAYSFQEAARKAYTSVLDTTYYNLATGNFSQNWTNTNLITTNNNWSGVPSIMGYQGDGLVGTTGFDPQLLVADGSGTAIDVNANQTNPNTFLTGGITEFAIANPTIALAGSGTANAPHLVLHLDTTGQQNVRVSYTLRDIENSTDSAIQPVALQYRIGNTGNFINLPDGFVPDATHPSANTTRDAQMSILLPVDVNNQSQLQVRFLTTDATGNDEWVGIDDIQVTSTAIASNSAPVAVNDTYTVAENGSLTTAAAVTSLILDSDPGNYVGQGDYYSYTPVNGTFSASRNFDNGVSVGFNSPAFSGGWSLNFAAPSDALLTPGNYTGATRWPFQAFTNPGLSVSGQHRGNNTLSGQFTINQIVYGTGTEIISFDASFEQLGQGDTGFFGGRVKYRTTPNNLLPGVLTNDTDAENTALTATLVSDPANGTLTFNSDGSFTYTPNPGFTGTDTFTYRANDSLANSAPATVTLNVGVNDPPVNTVPTAQSTNEDTALAFSSANNNLISISDPDAGTNPVKVTLNANNGSLTLSGTSGLTFISGDGTADASMTFTGAIANINAALSGISFNPVANFYGAASIQVTTNDQGNGGSGGALSDIDTVSITVNSVNDAPSFIPGGNQSAIAGAGAQTVNNWATGFNRGNIYESSQSLLGYQIVSNTAPNLFSVAPTIDTTGKLTYTPAASLGASATATIGIIVRDNGGTANGGQDTSTIRYFDITVNPNIAPLNVVINEVAWMGTNVDFNDEWIELYNPTANAIDLSGWTLTSGDGTPDITIPTGKIIPAGGYFLLERTADTTVSDVTADLIYTGSLANTGETLTLKAPDGVVIDTANGDGGAWPAGVNATSPTTVRLTMERTNPLAADTDSNWHRNDGVTRNGTDAGGNLIYGTPKAANSLPVPPGVTVTPITSTTTEAEGTASFAVKLNTIPTGNVTINLSSSDTTEGTLSISSLTFTPDNWNIPQTVTVTGVDDAVVDGNITYSIVTGATVSTDSIYNNINPADVTLVNNDNDTPIVNITAIDADARETGANTGTFRISRNDTIGDLIVYMTIDGTSTASTSDYTLSGSSLVTSGTDAKIIIPNGSDFVDITLTPNDDTLYEGLEALQLKLAAGSYTIGSNNAATVTIADNDPLPSLSISDVIVTEGNLGITNATFTVTLSGASVLPVTVNYATSDSTATTVDGDYTSFTSTPITFNPGETTKTITVAVNGDNKFETNETFNVNLSGATNATIADNTGVGTITNDENQPQISIDDVSITEGNDGTANAIFTVSLSNPSSLPVSVNYATANNTAIASSDYTSTNGTLTFNAGVTTQTISVPVVGDLVSEASESFFVNLSNPINATIADNQGIGTIIDNDAAGFTISSIGGNTTEVGGKATFTVKLNSAPTADVTIGLTSSDTTEGKVSASSLTFSANNWNIAQTVTVTGVDDAIADGNIPYSIITAPVVSTDSKYNNLNPNDVAVTNIDNDIAGFTITPARRLQTTEAGVQASFTVKLNTQPTAVVTLGLVSSDTSEGRVSTSSLTFTPNNWNIAQTVTVTGVNDNIVDGNIAYKIITAPAVSADIKYNKLNPINVTVTNADNDTTQFNLINGTLVSETLVGTTQSDRIYGFGGHDTISAGLGNDQIYGDDGNDTLIGDISNSLVAGGDDIIYGGTGSDRIYGNDGNDSLYGESGNDQIFGDSGNDLLRGGLGNDMVTGGTGRDTFVLARGEGTDIIRDFQIGSDFIGLAGGLTITQLLITQRSSQSVITLSDGEVLAALNNVNAATLQSYTASTFVTI